MKTPTFLERALAPENAPWCMFRAFWPFKNPTSHGDVPGVLREAGIVPVFPGE